MSKFISKEEASDCQSWTLPSVSDASSNESDLLTASQIEALQKQAYEEAYKQGFAEGMESGKQAIQQQLKYFSQLMSALDKPFSDLDQQVDEELVTLVKALVRQMIRREVKTDPGQIMAVIRDAIESLPVASRKVQLHLHPEDAALVAEFYKMGEQEQAWIIIEDPLINRGGCKVVTDVTQVDATLETRLTQLFAQVFGERQNDSDD